MELFELSCPNCGAPLSGDLTCEMCGSRFILNGGNNAKLVNNHKSLSNDVVFLGEGDGIVGLKTASMIKACVRGWRTNGYLKHDN